MSGADLLPGPDAAGASAATAEAPTSAPPGAVETAPCYCCAGTQGAPRLRWLLLPAVSYHVRCLDCGRSFNARTGESNGPVFLLYLLCVVGGVAAGSLSYLLVNGSW